MIITLELLKSCGVCEGAYNWTERALARANRQSATWEEGRENLLPYLSKLPKEEGEGWLKWYDSLLTDPRAIMFYGDHKILNEYRIFNDVTHQYEFFTSLEEATIRKPQIEEEFFNNRKTSFSVIRDIDNEDGTVTWINVDPFTFDVEDDYQVFNIFTGKYQVYENLSSAREFQKSLEDEIKQQAIRKIEQKVTSADGKEVCWIPPQ